LREQLLPKKKKVKKVTMTGTLGRRHLLNIAVCVKCSEKFGNIQENNISDGGNNKRVTAEALGQGIQLRQVRLVR